jgi:hypothetical protein
MNDDILRQPNLPGAVPRRLVPPRTARALLALALIWAVDLRAVSAAAPPEPHDPFLARLAGPWTLSGTVRGGPARYSAVGSWVLAGAWLEFAMSDVAMPPAYAARVFFGADAHDGSYVVHWLDRFGAAGARVVGTGRRDGDRLVFTFPYAESEFRDTLTLAAGARTGTLLLEARQPDGSWATFASYTLQRAAP